MTLADIKPGESCTVLGLVGKQNLMRRRIIDMGVTIGTQITVRKLAPLGDPIEINLRGYELSLRLDEARQIIVEKRGK